jgi:hypothetical protein
MKLVIETESRITCLRKLACVKSHFSTARNQHTALKHSPLLLEPKLCHMFYILSRKNSYPQILHQFQCTQQPPLLSDQITKDTAVCSMSHTTVKGSTEL